MFKIDYPEADKHLTSHCVMLTTLEIAVVEYRKTGNAKLIVDFVSDHYVNHLKGDETSLALFIQKKRREQAARAQKGKTDIKAPAIQPRMLAKPPVKK